jgi:glucose/arabinose dehydrogenase
MRKGTATLPQRKRCSIRVGSLDDTTMRNTTVLKAGLIALAAAGAAFAVAFAADWGGAAQAPVPGLTRAPAAKSAARFSVVTVASGLDHPWGLRFLPDGRMIVTERVGRLRLVSPSGHLSPPVAGVPKVVASGGQAGLFDVALDSGFSQNHTLYIAYFERRPGGGQGLSVARARLEENGAPRLENVKVIFRAEPDNGPAINLGGRLLIGKGGTLFVTVGDRFTQRDKAQDLSADNGKIVRIATDGSTPKDNPFVSRKGARGEIWSFGHRNPEGLAFRPDGTLWDVEHGAKGGDEINLIKPGHNYGWPVITYGVDYSGEKIGVGTSKPGMDQPVYYWDPSIAPSGMAFYTGDLFPQWKGNLFVGALKFKQVRRLVMKGDKVVGEETLLADLGERIRDIRQGPDGALYILTDNEKGRILKLVPKR